MTEEILKEMRKRYKAYESIIKRHNEKANELKELMLDDKVKLFADLLEIGIEDPRVKEIPLDIVIDRVLYFYSDPVDFINKLAEENNKIYFCDNIIRELKVYGYAYKKYKNIEDFTDTHNIEINKTKEFEKNNTVVYGNDYETIRNEFVKNAIKTNQQKAVKKLIKKYGSE